MQHIADHVEKVKNFIASDGQKELKNSINAVLDYAETLSFYKSLITFWNNAMYDKFSGHLEKDESLKLIALIKYNLSVEKIANAMKDIKKMNIDKSKKNKIH